MSPRILDGAGEAVLSMNKGVLGIRKGRRRNMGEEEEEEEEEEEKALGMSPAWLAKRHHIFHLPRPLSSEKK